MIDLRAQCTRELSATLNLLKELATRESPSSDKVAVDACSAYVATRLSALGAEVAVVPQTGAGNQLSAFWPGNDQSTQFLTLCHLDTVWPKGTLATMPLREDGGKLLGPGVYDMKAGTAILLTALKVMKDATLTSRHSMRMLFTGDEEVGSLTSRDLIEAEARRSCLAIVLEPALAGGQLKTFRKGVGDFVVVAHGRAAHAGGDHQKGINAIEELSYHIPALQKLTDYESGTTINVGTIKGGSASNVVPERAEMEVDFRISRMAEIDRVVTAVRGLQPVLPGARLEISGGLNRPPMEHTATMVKTFEQARRLAAGIGLTLEEGSTGGGSDGNFTAALGIPTLDGMGAVGDGAHAAHEHIIISSLADRAALLATILTQWES
ncbi:MAG TPA: M20 family metallopeptidase [Anaerolineae bacterium]|nr:M20 family metallopeptidase [Anaerolineae bacterium]